MKKSNQAIHGSSLAVWAGITLSLLCWMALPAHAQSIKTNMWIVPVTEGSTRALQVWLSAEPVADVSLTITKDSGAESISLVETGPFRLDAQNWGTGMTVTFRADTDGNANDEIAVFTISETTGAGLTEKEITVRSIDTTTPYNVSGTLLNDTVWDDTTQTYTITNTVTVPAGVTLTINSGVAVRQTGNFNAIVVDGGTIVCEPDSLLMLHTLAHTVAGSRHNGVVLRNGAVGEFSETHLYSWEQAWPSSDLSTFWAAVIASSGTSEVSLEGCRFNCLSTGVYLTPYAVRIDNTTATLADANNQPNFFYGYRIGIGLVLGDISPSIARAEFRQCTHHGAIQGTLTSELVLHNAKQVMYQPVTIANGATLTLAPGSTLSNSQDNSSGWARTLTVAPEASLVMETAHLTTNGEIYLQGNLTATHSSFHSNTHTHSAIASRRNGIMFSGNSTGLFQDSVFTSNEAAWNTADDMLATWSAIVTLGDDADVEFSSCSFETLDARSQYRTTYAIRADGGNLIIGDSGDQPCAFTGFRTGFLTDLAQVNATIAACQFSDVAFNSAIKGTLSNTFTVNNPVTCLFGAVTVANGATMNIAEGGGIRNSRDNTTTRSYLLNIAQGAHFNISSGTLEMSQNISVAGILNATNASFHVFSHATNSPDTRRNGFMFTGTSTGRFLDSAFSSYEATWNTTGDMLNHWSAIVVLNNDADVEFWGCSFASLDSRPQYRTTYAIKADRGNLTMGDSNEQPCTFLGLRYGMVFDWTKLNTDVAPCVFEDMVSGVSIGLHGDVEGAASISSQNRHSLLKDLSVTSTGQLTTTPGFGFDTQNYTLTIANGGSVDMSGATCWISSPIVVNGSLEATNSFWNIYTYAFSNDSGRKNGFMLNNNGAAEFTDCTFRSRESRGTGSDTDFSTIFTMSGNSSLYMTRCFVFPRTDSGHKTRFVIRSSSSNTLYLRDCSFYNNNLVARLDAFPTAATVIGNAFEGNTWTIDNKTTSTLMAHNNWWGSSTGPTHIQNPGGTGDPVSDYVDYGQNLLTNDLPQIHFLDPLTGQQFNNLTTEATQPDVALFGFRVAPEEEVALEGVGIRVFNLQGIEFSQFHNFRLYLDEDGSGSVDPDQAPMVGGPAQIVTNWPSTGQMVIYFADAITPPNADYGFVLLADITELEAGDRFEVTLDNYYYTSVAAGVPYLSLVTAAWHEFGGGVVLAQATAGQVSDSLNGYPNQNEVVIHRFRLVGEGQEVSALEFKLTDIVGLTESKMVSVNLFHDANGNGRIDAGDTMVGGPAIIQVIGNAGTIRFEEPFTISSDYLLNASFRRLGDGNRFTISLAPDGVELASEAETTGTEQTAIHRVESPYMLSISPGWAPPRNFGESVTMTDFQFLALRVLPVGRTIRGFVIDLSGVLGITANDISNVRLYNDVNNNGRFDENDVLLATASMIDINGQSGYIMFDTEFVTHSNLLLLADFSNLAHGDEMTISIAPENIAVPSGYLVTGAVPGIRYMVGTGLSDRLGGNMQWTLTWRSPGGTTCNGRYNNAGNRVILGYDTGSAWIYDSNANTPILMLKDHYDQVQYAGFNSDDSAAITVTRDGAVYIWDVQTGNQRSAMFSDLLVTAGVPSPDFSKLMVITEGKGILLDIDTEQRMWEFTPGDAEVTAIAYSPDGEYVALAATGSTVRHAYLLDAQTMEEVNRYRGHTQGVTAIGFTGDGSRLMTASSDATVQIWPTLGSQPLSTLSLQGQNAQGAAVSRDGSRVALVTGTGTNAQLRVYNATVTPMLELYAINLNTVSEGRWGGTLDTLGFDASGERVLVTSKGGGWAANAAFATRDGRFLNSWGPHGRFYNHHNARPRISTDGDKVFAMTNWGANVMFRSIGKTYFHGLNTDRGYDISADGSRLSYFGSNQRLQVYNVSDTGFNEFLNRNVGIAYHAISMSPAGDMVIGGDILYSGHSGEILANYALPDAEYQSTFSPDGRLWGFAHATQKSLITVRTDDPNATLYYLVFTDPYTPYKLFLHPDGKRIAAVDKNHGVQMYDMTTEDPVGLYRFANNNDAVLWDDGTMMLIGGRNQVHLVDVTTGRILRYFYPQHSSFQNVDVYSVQFAHNDTMIMIAWGSHNYIETYERSQAVGITITPATRTLSPGQQQPFYVKVTYDDGSELDVTPHTAGQLNRAELTVEPEDAAMVSGNVITVATGATGQFTVRATYRENRTSFMNTAEVTVGQSDLVALTARPAKMTLNPGVFRSITYIATYDDGYEHELTTGVDLSVDRPNDMVIADQSVKVNIIAQPGDFLVTGTYTDLHGTARTAQTTVTMFGPKTAWERYRVTGGGYGTAGAFNAQGTQLACGSSSGAISLYKVGVTPNQYQLEKVIPAQNGPIPYLGYTSTGNLITVSHDGTIQQWNLEVSETAPQASFAHHTAITAAALSGTSVVFGDAAGNVGVYQIATNDTDWVVPVHTGEVTAIAYDGTTILTGGEDRRVKRLQKSDGFELWTATPHTEPVVGVGFLSTTVFYSVGQDYVLDFWQKSDNELIRQYELSAVPTSSVVLGGHLYIATTQPCATWKFNADGLLLGWLEHPPNQGKISSLLTDPSGKYLLTGRMTSMVEVETEFGTIEVVSPFSSWQFWEAGRGIFRGSLAHSHPLQDAHVSPDGATIFTQCAKRTMQWSFDPQGATCEARNLMETGYFIAPSFSGMDFTADAGILATRVNVSIYMFDTLTKLLWKTLHTPGGPFAISPNGTRMATSDIATKLWDLSNLSLIHEGPTTQRSNALAFRGEDNFLGGIQDDRVVGVWNENGLLYNTFTTQYGPVQLSINSIGDRVAAITVDVQCDMFTCNYDYYLEIFDITQLTGERPLIGRIFLTSSNEDLLFGEGEGQLNVSVAVSDDTTMALVGPSGDRPAKLVHVNDGATIREFLPPGGSGTTNLGAPTVGFFDNDNTLMIGWGEGFVELYHRSQPQSLNIFMVPVEIPQRELSLNELWNLYGRRRQLIAKPGDSFQAQSIVQYENGAELNVTSTIVLSTDRPDVVSFDNTLVHINPEAATAVVTITAEYEELGSQLMSAITILVSEYSAGPEDFNADGKVNVVDLLMLLEFIRTGNLLGDLNDDGIVNGIDLFLFSQAWGINQAAARDMRDSMIFRLD